MLKFLHQGLQALVSRLDVVLLPRGFDALFQQRNLPRVFDTSFGIETVFAGIVLKLENQNLSLDALLLLLQ